MGIEGFDIGGFEGFNLLGGLRCAFHVPWRESEQLTGGDLEGF